MTQKLSRSEQVACLPRGPRLRPLPNEEQVLSDALLDEIAASIHWGLWQFEDHLLNRRSVVRQVVRAWISREESS